MNFILFLYFKYKYGLVDIIKEGNEKSSKVKSIF